MNKLILLIAFLLTISGFSQSIDVSTTALSVPQLVNNVLINSPCVSATNITWSTGTNFGSSNGIGFFQNTNVNFPMKSGVVLSTGNVYNAAGPNNTFLSDGSTAWPGDPSLEATLAAAGIPMVSKNATTLEFDFTPISSYFSFDFIFASEEYGNWQCLYSDAFAFLLTDMTTNITTNLAVVPNTNTPISVSTIRDFLYQSSCPSSNPEYFGSYNGGTEANTSATNFNGQTKVLTAKSTLIPGVPYHIKLVIADRLDPQSDSAIFLSSESFNIGQNILGLDQTIATNNAVCFGSTKTINTGLNTNHYSFIWKKDDQIIPGENGPSITIDKPGLYSATYTNIFNSCLPMTDNLLVEYYPEIITKDPKNLSRCNLGASSYTYNLDSNTSIVKNGLDPLTVVTYHISQNDAENNLNPLPTQYVGADGQTIYLRIQLPNNGCSNVKQFQLLLSPPPIAFKPKDLSKCSKKEDGTAIFNLDPQTKIILGTQSPSIYSVSYYNTLNDATNATNPITQLNDGLYTTQTIYARVQNIDDSSCFDITNFDVIVNPAPPVDKLKSVIVCSEYILPTLSNGDYYTQPKGGGIKLSAGSEITETQTFYIFNQPDGPENCSSSSSFTVTFVDEDSIAPKDITHCGSYTLPKLTIGKYYTAPGGTGSEIPEKTIISISQTIFFYYSTTTEPFCSVDSQFKITINPAIEIGEREDVFECSSYTLPQLNIGEYFSLPNGEGNSIPPGTVITDSQTIYVYVAKTIPTDCTAEDVFEVYIGMAQPQNIAQCNGYTLPELSIGNYYSEPKGNGQKIPAGTVIDESTTLYVYAPTTSGGNNCTDNMSFSISISQPKIDILKDRSECESYILPNLNKGEYFTGPGGTGVKLFPGHLILSTQVIYTFARLNDTCYNESPFTVTINHLPKLDSRGDIDQCDQYTLTELNAGNYFTGPKGTGNILPAGTVIKTSQIIYIYTTTNTIPPCTAESSFKVNIFSATADALTDVVACDSYPLPILSPLNKYFTETGGPNGNGVEILPGTVIKNSQTIYVFKEALIRTSFSCSNQTSFTVTINHTPDIPLIGDINTCENYTLPVLNIGDYYTEPNASGTLLHGGDVLTTTQTVYVYAHTGTTPDCPKQINFKVTIFNVDNLQDVTACEDYPLPKLNVGNYYTEPNGAGTLLPQGTVIKTPQNVYIYGISPFNPSCTDQVMFKITMVARPIANSVSPKLRAVCDEDGKNDGITLFDLTNLSSTVLGNQTGNEFDIAYYASIQEATTQTNAIITETTLSTVYVRVNNILAPDCYALETITIYVNKLPESTPVDGFICIDSKTGKVLNPYTIYSNLNPSKHKFIWRNEAGEIISLKNNYLATAAGVYSLTATNTSTGCESVPVKITVTVSEPPIVSYTVDDAFQDHQSIVVTATGQGNNFEYQLDDSAFQDSNIFEDISSGIHLITVRDKYGCGITTLQAIVINYPKYFTPNGDGYNDTWNIFDLSGQPNAIVSIFDRQGKLITQLNTKNSGWDGTFNGNNLPSDDYWFSVTYKDDNQVDQEFRSHFAMKR